jgi:hypothetical protein
MLRAVGGLATTDLWVAALVAVEAVLLVAVLLVATVDFAWAVADLAAGFFAVFVFADGADVLTACFLVVAAVEVEAAAACATTLRPGRRRQISSIANRYRVPRSCIHTPDSGSRRGSTLARIQPMPTLRLYSPAQSSACVTNHLRYTPFSIDGVRRLSCSLCRPPLLPDHQPFTLVLHLSRQHRATLGRLLLRAA